MKKILTASAVCIAGLLILSVVVFFAFSLVMSRHDGWPSFSFSSFFSGEYFLKIDEYYNSKTPKDTELSPETSTSTSASTSTSDTSDFTSSEDTDSIETELPAVFFAVSQSEVSLEAGKDTYVGIAAFPPESADEDLYSAFVADSSVASVQIRSSALTVTGVSEGTTVIHIYYDDSQIASVSVTVTAPETETEKETEVTSAETEEKFPDYEFPIVQADHIDPDLPMLALTFDDGPSKYTEKLLDIFKEHNCHGTFFMIGKQVSGRKDTVIRMKNEGHDLGVHTWNHKKLTTLSLSEIRSEISSARDIIEQVTGVRPVLARPPYGSVNDDVKKASKLDGFYIINWSVDTLDWKLRNAERIYDSVMEQAKDGAIILLHDLHKETVDAMVNVIPDLISRGYQLVTVTELLSFREKAPETGTVIRRQ